MVIPYFSRRPEIQQKDKYSNSLLLDIGLAKLAPSTSSAILIPSSVARNPHPASVGNLN